MSPLDMISIGQTASYCINYLHVSTRLCYASCVVLNNTYCILLLFQIILSNHHVRSAVLLNNFHIKQHKIILLLLTFIYYLLAVYQTDLEKMSFFSIFSYNNFIVFIAVLSDSFHIRDRGNCCETNV